MTLDFFSTYEPFPLPPLPPALTIHSQFTAKSHKMDYQLTKGLIYILPIDV